MTNSTKRLIARDTHPPASVRDCLERIEALAEAPHWTAERRWKIAAIARIALNMLTLEEAKD